MVDTETNTNVLIAVTLSLRLVRNLSDLFSKKDSRQAGMTKKCKKINAFILVFGLVIFNLSSISLFVCVYEVGY